MYTYIYINIYAYTYIFIYSCIYMYIYIFATEAEYATAFFLTRGRSYFSQLVHERRLTRLP